MNYEELMRQCFSLARKAEGRTLTNPLVGAVLIKDGKILAKGYHKGFGKDHAEVDCLNNFKGDPEGATLLVNLEPCSHYGKKPPCVKEIINRKIKSVVISNTDPNPKVDGLKILKNEGIEIITGVLEDEGRALNEKFFFNMKYKRPLIALKYAQSLDGKIATQNNDSKWITNEKSRAYVHKLRSSYDAILVGKNTLINDNSRLNTRIPGGIDPVRVIVSNNLGFDKDLKVFNLDSDKDTYIATRSDGKTDLNAKLINCKEKSGQVDLDDLVKKLYELNIGSILVEGGSSINTSFLKENLVDKIYEFIAPIIVGGSDSKSAFMGEGAAFIKDSKKFRIDNILRFDEDIMLEVRNVYRNID